MGDWIDLTGLLIGELTVLRYAGYRKWACRCSCGREVEKFGTSLRANRTRVCSKTYHAKWLHKRHPAEYAAWCSAKRRKVLCAEWKTDFAGFLVEVGEQPDIGHRLARLDESEPLGPGNFEWTTRSWSRRKR